MQFCYSIAIDLIQHWKEGHKEGIDTIPSPPQNTLVIYLFIFYLLVLYEAEKPASKVCGQPVPTAREYSVHT